MSTAATLSDEMMVDQAFAEAQRLKQQKTDFDFGAFPSRQAARPWHQRLGTAPTGSSNAARPLVMALLCALVLVAGIGLRHTIVAAVPETAVLYQRLGLPVNLRGLELQGIKSMIMQENGVELLIVQGDIANITGKTQSVPPLQFSVRDAKGAEIYSWVASADLKPLDANTKGTFRRRLASPPLNGVDVLVRFAGRPATNH